MEEHVRHTTMFGRPVIVDGSLTEPGEVSVEISFTQFTQYAIGDPVTLELPNGEIWKGRFVDVKCDGSKETYSIEWEQKERDGEEKEG